MGRSDLVLGLIETPFAPGESFGQKFRDLTIAWSRYGYRDSIIERASVEEILDEAAQRGHRYCLIQAPGLLIRESWRGEGETDQDFLSSLVAWSQKNDFLVVGRILAEEGSWFGLDSRCLLVDLERYQALHHPRFGDPQERDHLLPVAEIATDDGEVRSLQPLGREATARPGHSGWGFVEAALRGGFPVLGFEPPLAHQLLDLAPVGGGGAAHFGRYMGDGIARYPEERDGADLSPDQRELLDIVALHAANARRGVFLWNIESYGDVEQPPPVFRGPVSRIYSVAAGFKPNRILQTHEFDADTSVVFFDYSQRALDVRKFMVESWDGTDFPSFLAGLFERFPYPETYYHLWQDRTPAQVSEGELDTAWSRELARWGGEDAFAEHWCAYRTLEHEFVHCDVVGDPAPLLERVRADPGAVIWWSNAFFTVYSNWHLDWGRRRDRYEAWVSRLAELCPELLIYGSDHNNTNVNWIRIGDYWSRYCELAGDDLVPRKLQQHEIRM
jgi:hypothetical protein